LGWLRRLAGEGKAAAHAVALQKIGARA